MPAPAIITSRGVKRSLLRGSSVLRTLRICSVLALDSLCKAVTVRTDNVALIVRLDAVGDFFMWLQSGAVEIAQYAKASGRRTVLLANGTWAEYAREIGLWDEVIAVDPRKLMRAPWYRVRLLARIRRLGAQMLIQPRSARVFLQEDAIVRIAGAAESIGSSGTLLNITEFWRAHGNRFYDRLIEVAEQQGVHEIVRNGQFVSQLTGRCPSRFRFEVPRDDTAANRMVVVVPGAGQIGRVWPLEKLARLVRHLWAHHPELRVIVLGADSDRPLARRLRELASGAELDDRVGSTTLSEFVATIAAARLVICNESSAYHVAMAHGKPVLCFLGGGHYGWFAPYPTSAGSKALVLNTPMECYGCNWNCKYPSAAGGSLLCVAAIEADAAIRAVETLLAA